MDSAMVLHLPVSSAANITININSIPMLNDVNFKSWQENVMIVLRASDLDIVLRFPSPAPHMDKSSTDEKKNMEKWERLNRMCMMIMKRVIPEAFRGTMSEKITTAKEFLEDIEKMFDKNEKAKISTLLENLILMRYKGK
ncbi:uncharacterized protein LOC109841881 [Asparagus officinalis]|uniref:uncharacterized protein LOC109841881 n=1 Tax=Asparagus officinalis TaxID=4686 RepID=UPI00098E1AC1|nr:uncharacterized protein LOC109841881 [Asparagus officinalis]